MTVFGAAPSVHYHFNSQAVAVDGNGRLTSCPDRQGLAQLLAVAGTTAPKLLADGLGRKFLRFNGGEAAIIQNALTIAGQRGFTAIALARVHQSKQANRILVPRFLSYASATVNTAAPENGSMIRPVNFATNAVAYLAANSSPQTTANAADCGKVIPGVQLQVIGVASRTSANGGTRLYINNDKCDVGQSGLNNAVIGAVLGGRGASDNSEALSTGAGDLFDLYELAIWSSELANTTADALVAAAVSNWGIAPLDTNLIIEGDSISDGAATTLPVSPANCGGLAARLTEPGAGLIPANVRVIELASVGHAVPQLVNRRDATNTVFGLGKYPGGAAKNVVAFQIGRNDMTQQDNTAAQHYANVVALINTATTGYLQRGWSVVVAGNVMAQAGVLGTPPDGATNVSQRIATYRTLVFDGTGLAINATFQNDVLAGAGQTFDGLVTVKPVHKITVGGDSKFETTTDVNDTASGYYDSDQTHLRVAGMDLMASGGDHPARGYAAILA